MKIMKKNKGNSWMNSERNFSLMKKEHSKEKLRRNKTLAENKFVGVEKFC